MTRRGAVVGLAAILAACQDARGPSERVSIDAGVDVEAAKTKSPARPLAGQTLPAVSHELPPIPEGIVVHVTTTEVRMRDRRLAEVGTDGLARPPARAGLVIGPLVDAIAAERSGERPLVIAIDARLPARMLFDILTSGTKAGVSTFAIVVATGPQAYGAIATRFGHLADTPDGLDIRIARDRIYIEAFSRHEGTEFDHERNAAGFEQLADEILHYFDGGIAAHARVSPFDDVDIGTLVLALDTVRGQICRGNATCRASDLAVALAEPLPEELRLTNESAARRREPPIRRSTNSPR